jgi:hypothetical protein
MLVSNHVVYALILCYNLRCLIIFFLLIRIADDVFICDVLYIFDH